MNKKVTKGIKPLKIKGLSVFPSSQNSVNLKFNHPIYSNDLESILEQNNSIFSSNRSMGTPVNSCQRHSSKSFKMYNSAENFFLNDVEEILNIINEYQLDPFKVYEEAYFYHYIEFKKSFDNKKSETWVIQNIKNVFVEIEFNNEIYTTEALEPQSSKTLTYAIEKIINRDNLLKKVAEDKINQTGNYLHYKNKDGDLFHEKIIGGYLKNVSRSGKILKMIITQKEDSSILWLHGLTDKGTLIYGGSLRENFYKKLKNKKSVNADGSHFQIIEDIDEVKSWVKNKILTLDGIVF